jgi:hypothetical protein
MTGYASKRSAARDKLLDDDDTLTIAYATGYYDGKKATQPAQEPPQYSFKAYWAEDGRIGVVACIIRPDGGPHIMEEFIDPPLPAQEPVAYLCGPDENGLFGLPTADKACKDCFPVYRQSPQRPWVGLTDKAIAEFGTWYDNREEEVGWVPPSEIVAYIDDKLRSKNI